MASVSAGEPLVPLPHQCEALDGIDELRQGGSNRFLLEMATGLGKTVVAAKDVAREIGRGNVDRALYLCHRTGILRQARQVFERELGDEVSHGFMMAGQRDDQQQVLYGTFQTMGGDSADGKLYETFDRDAFDYIAVDEGHHGPAPTYRAVLGYYDPATLLGMSAVPNRHDGQDILDIFGQTAYRKTLPEGINERLLSPLRYHMYTDRLRSMGDLRELAESASFNQLNRSLFIPRRDEEVVRIFAEELEEIGEPHGLVFCKTIEHAERLYKLMARLLPYTVATIHSEQPDKLHDFVTDALLDGELQLATVVSQFDEGIDVPHLNFLGFLRDSASEGVWLNQLGRGLRRGKPLLRVADLATTLDRITMVHKLETQIREQAEEGQPVPTPEVRELYPAASFNFSKEAEEVTVLAEAIRARIERRKQELALAKLPPPPIEPRTVELAVRKDAQPETIELTEAETLYLTKMMLDDDLSAAEFELRAVHKRQFGETIRAKAMRDKLAEMQVRGLVGKIASASGLQPGYSWRMTNAAFESLCAQEPFRSQQATAVAKLKRIIDGYKAEVEAAGQDPEYINLDVNKPSSASTYGIETRNRVSELWFARQQIRVAYSTITTPELEYMAKSLSRWPRFGVFGDTISQRVELHDDKVQALWYPHRADSWGYGGGKIKRRLTVPQIEAIIAILEDPEQTLRVRGRHLPRSRRASGS